MTGFLVRFIFQPTISIIAKKSLIIKKWVNSANDLTPSGDSIKFRIFQGSSHSDRRDWIHSLKAGFNEQNFMGMNATDYGGGIPVVDFWRKDDGLAIGLLEPEAKLISLPVDYDRDAFTAKISIEYIFPEAKMMFPGDTIHSFETFVSVHQKDFFQRSRFMGPLCRPKVLFPLIPNRPHTIRYGVFGDIKEILT